MLIGITDDLPREIVKRGIYLKLISTACQRTLMTTSELAKNLGLPNSARSKNLVISLLNELSAVEEDKKNPMLTSVIIKKVKTEHQPTQAWKKLYAAYRGLEFESIEKQAEELWQKELEKVYAHYRIS
jgi:hypothetical protein